MYRILFLAPALAMAVLGCDGGLPHDDPGVTEPNGALAGILAAHNGYREQHCAPALDWSRAVAREAQEWADSLVGRGCAFEHNPGTPYGENLAFASPPGRLDAAGVVALWYAEEAQYDYDQAQFSSDTGHFTQVVWVGTGALGCGVARCANAEIWVCNYDPPGNFLGRFRDNVLPPSCR